MWPEICGRNLTLVDVIGADFSRRKLLVKGETSKLKSRYVILALGCEVG